MSEMMQGLTISVVGVLITFFALGIFILIMVILQRVFPAKSPQKEEAVEPQPVIKMELEQVSKPEEDEGAVVAAITAAVSYLQTASHTSLGVNLESGRGRWWAANRPVSRQASVIRKK